MHPGPAAPQSGRHALADGGQRNGRCVVNPGLTPIPRSTSLALPRRFVDPLGHRAVAPRPGAACIVRSKAHAVSRFLELPGDCLRTNSCSGTATWAGGLDGCPDRPGHLHPQRAPDPQHGAEVTPNLLRMDIATAATIQNSAPPARGAASPLPLRIGPSPTNITRIFIAALREGSRL